MSHEVCALDISNLAHSALLPSCLPYFGHAYFSFICKKKHAKGHFFSFNVVSTIDTFY